MALGGRRGLIRQLTFEPLRESHCVQRGKRGGGALGVISLQEHEYSGVMITLEPSVATIEVPCSW